MKTRELLLLLALTATTGMQAQRIKGSDTVLPIAQQTAERFMTLNPSARVTVTGGGTGVGISALLDQTTDIAMASRAIKFSEKMKVKAAGEAGRSSHRLRCPCRSGPPLQPSETTDPPTTGRYLPGQSHQLAASGRRRPQNRSLLPRDFLRYLRVLQGKRTEKQELHEQQSLHACHGSHYPIRQPNSRSHRICGSSLCITAYQDTRRFIRRAALCRSHAGECHQ